MVIRAMDTLNRLIIMDMLSLHMVMDILPLIMVEVVEMVIITMVIIMDTDHTIIKDIMVEVVMVGDGEDIEVVITIVADGDKQKRGLSPFFMPLS